VVEGIAFLTWPILAGMVMVADTAVPLLFGEQWRGAVTSLKFLAIYHMSVAVFAPFSYVFLVTGGAHHNRQIAVLGALVLPACFWIGAVWWEDAGLAAAWWVGVPVFGIPSLILLKRAIGFGFVHFWRAIQAPALATIGMTIALAVLPSTPFGLRSDVARLATAIGLGAVVFVRLALATRGRAVMAFIAGLRQQPRQS